MKLLRYFLYHRNVVSEVAKPFTEKHEKQIPNFGEQITVTTCCLFLIHTDVVVNVVIFQF